MLILGKITGRKRVCLEPFSISVLFSFLLPSPATILKNASPCSAWALRHYERPVPSLRASIKISYAGGTPHARGTKNSSRARRVCSTCASRVQHVCTTCAPRVHLYFVGISEQWSGQGLPQYNENITYLFLRAQFHDMRENTGAHVVHTWCTRAAHVVHACCTRAAHWARGRVASARTPAPLRTAAVTISWLFSLFAKLVDPLALLWHLFA